MSLTCLCKAIEVNDTLEAVKLDDNIFDENSLKELDKAVRDKHIKVYLSSHNLPLNAKDIFIGTKNIIII